MMRIAINGMGRIGRLLFRRLIDSSDIELVAVNDIMDSDNLAYLLKYDSIYGTFAGTIAHQSGAIVANGKVVKALQQKDPAPAALERSSGRRCAGMFGQFFEPYRRRAALKGRCTQSTVVNYRFNRYTPDRVRF